MRLAVTTPWYPNPANPFAGSFVQTAVEAVAERGAEVTVYHAEDWATPADRLSAALVRRGVHALLAGPARPDPVPVREGHLVRLPAPVVPRRDYAQHGHSQADVVRRALPRGVLEADVVHGHVGVFGGWVAAALADPSTTVFVTEHATFLARILAQTRAREMYDQVLARSERFFCVSEVLRRQVAEVFPHHAAKLEVLPNAVALERIPMRPEPVRDLRRWLYVGRLLEHKGVERLVESFAVCAREDPALELTLLGDGRLRDRLRERAADLGVAARVHLPGPVPHHEVVDQLHSHDLLVHLSDYETFGMTIVESVAAGTPVLVTRCGGPEETMAGLEGVAGATVGLDGGVEEVVDAFRALRREAATLRMDAARGHMLERYGMDAVGARLMAHYTGGGAS